MAVLNVRLLGPPELTADGVPVALPAGRGAAAFAVLALEHPRGATVDHLVDALWAARPPRSVDNVVQVHMSRLRKLGVHIVRSGGGYRLADDVDVDAIELVHLVRSGEAELREGRFDAAVERLDRAVRLVRGPVLDGLRHLPFAEAEVGRLEATVLAARSARIEANVRLGRYHEVLPELESLVSSRPGDERLVGLHMQALHGVGRRIDALAAFETARDHLDQELGVAPSVALRTLHHAMVRQTYVAPAPRPAARPVPRQAPAGAAVFVGRSAEVAELLACLVPRSGSAVIASVDGPPGIGKTALALHAVQYLAERFPDGVLHASLGGGDPAHAPSAETILGRFLAALGVPAGAVPADAEEAAARYRTELAGRRILVVLDDGLDADQVRPLLPAAAGCAAVVTSRASLGLTEAVSFQVGLLDQADAGALLVRTARMGGVAADDPAVVDVVEACGRLPLAIRIAGGRLVQRGPESLARLATLLGDESRRLGELHLGDLDVRSTFAVAYAQLRPDEQRAFRLLALLRGISLDVGIAAATLDRSVVVTVGLLRRLVDARLLDEVEPGRYRFHDLLRLFGLEQATSPAGPEPAAAIDRALHHELDGALAADARLAAPDSDSRPEDRADALRWFERELSNLVTTAVLAAAQDDPGTASVAWHLGDAMFRFLDRTKPWTDWETICRAGLRAARATGDRAGEASTLNRLGCVHRERGRLGSALECLLRALDLARAASDVALECSVLNNLGLTYDDAKDRERALECHERRLGLVRTIGDTYSVAVALNNLANIHMESGQLLRAEAMFAECRAIAGALGERRMLGMTLHNLAEVALRRSRFAEAAALYAEGAEHSHGTGDRHSQAHSLVGLGHARRGALGPDAAREPWQAARALFVAIDPATATVVDELLAGLPDEKR